MAEEKEEEEVEEHEGNEREEEKEEEEDEEGRKGGNPKPTHTNPQPIPYRTGEGWMDAKTVDSLFRGMHIVACTVDSRPNVFQGT